MGEEAPPRITADSLRARDEWRNVFPGAIVVSEETADEGVGHGFDGIDPSAMTRAFFRTSSSWSEVLEWYTDLLAEHGWLGTPVRDSWWRWRHPERAGERFDVLNRSHISEGWPATLDPDEPLKFEVLFRVSSQPGVVPGESATFDA
jgi:hypothetical protein